MRIVDYRLLVNYDEDVIALQNEVVGYIGSGWEPLGAVAVSMTAGDDGIQATTMLQAVVKREIQNGESSG